MNKSLLLSSLALGIGFAASGQTSGELNTKYPVIEAYEVRPGILMTPKYTADGQVCEMEFEPRRQTKDGITLTQSLSEKTVKELVNELVPEAARGKDMKGWFDDTVEGGFTTTRLTYENIVVELYGVTRPVPRRSMVAIIKWRNRMCSGKEMPKTSAPSATSHPLTAPRQAGQ